MKLLFIPCAAWILTAAGATSAAELGRLDLAAPGALVSTCGGMSFGGAVGDRVTGLPGRFSCDAAQTALPNVTVAAAATYDESPILVQTDASGQSAMGQTHLYAHFKARHDTVGFAAAAATGGWVDNLTLNPVNVSLIGQIASFSFTIDVGGTLAGQVTTDSFNSLARFGVKPYLNDASFAPGPESEFSVQGQGQLGFPYNETVNQIVTFTTDITLGTAFELGVFARALVGVASTGPVTVPSEATVDFSNTITWAGISAVSVGGIAVPYTLTSASGIDWTQPFAAAVPEPTSVLLWATGLALFGVRHRLGQRSPSKKSD